MVIPLGRAMGRGAAASGEIKAAIDWNAPTSPRFALLMATLRIGESFGKIKGIDGDPLGETKVA
jgi:hypothetical protein